METAPLSLEMIGEMVLPNTVTYKRTFVGGLSGLDYDPKTGEWVLISEDRATLGPARFYNAKLSYDKNGVHDLSITGMVALKQKDGSPFPSFRHYDLHHEGIVPDFESIRVDPSDGSIWYTSEGNRTLGFNPQIYHASKKGAFLNSFKVPDAFLIHKKPDLGIRKNQALEASSWTPDGQFFWTALEGPLLQDGPAPNAQESGFTRLTQYTRKGTIVGEYVYPLSSVPEHDTQNILDQNGVVEMLAINAHQFLVLERANLHETHAPEHYSCRIYQIDTSVATNIHPSASLLDASFIPVSKKLVLNLDTLDLKQIGNFEGIAFGPTLSDGHRSLVLVSNNTFNSKGLTQFFVFEVTQNK